MLIAHEIVGYLYWLHEYRPIRELKFDNKANIIKIIASVLFLYQKKLKLPIL